MIEMEKLTCLVDTREQKPWDMSPMQVKTATLDVGDYSLKGLEDQVAIERKNWADFLNCVGRERSRFDRAVIRMKGIPHRVIVVEGIYSDVLKGNFGLSNINRNAVISSVASWNRQGIAVMFLEDAETAGTWAKSFMFSVARKIWRVSRELSKAMGV